jgi:hypothetical protein
LAVLYIDADACPVKAEAERVATRHGWRMVLVSNGGIRPSANPLVESVFVIPLAAKCVAAGARVVKPNGDVLHGGNVGNALAMRDLMQDLRSADPFRQGGGKAFSKADRSRFLDVLEREIRAAR